MQISNSMSRNDNPQISNIKCRDDGGKITLTWCWPEGVEQVYVFMGEGRSESKLFTLQEYKKRGGFSAKKKPGVNAFSVFPFSREGGEDILNDTPNAENTIQFICRTPISYNLTEKTVSLTLASRYKNHEITLTAPYDIPPNIVCYEKNGIVYYLGEPLHAGQPLTRIIRTEKDDNISLFINEDFFSLYTLN